ncbi:MAG: hypothetical protein V5A88_09915 [Candidatus Thermoplasmatota archaeon]
MDKKTLVIIIGVVLILGGIVLMMITEPAGTEGSGPSGGIADVSEETRPYFWHGLILIIIGVVVALAASIKMV